ncbi:helix-turn-helix domain-containing protein [Vineibacter terrae]|uniref:helix-turn-helix domain-containing protein n=1 Tax=Vineibacter terrae TaxID=2586908 RepID=UPI002E32DFA5|nr:helix-turn-helix domain-containing protein [Vineibacter terrae]HEX2885695.1 helix-turn-helix domain-containing protein [Vineibacter terrae]
MSQATVSFHLPAPELRHAISTYYILRVAGSEPVEDMVHPEWANVRLVLSGKWRARFIGQAAQPVPPAAMSGALERGAVVRGTPGILIGAGLLPQGWVELTDQPANAFANRLRPLSDALGSDADDLLPALRAAAADGDALAILDRVFTGKRRRPSPALPLVRDIHAALVDLETRSVEDWADQVGVVPRQLERLCQRYLGLRPSRLLRRQRFLRTLAAIREVKAGGWSGLIDDHYVDQSHFIRDFHYFLDMSPSAYFARPQPFMREAGDRRKALLGSPVQGLHAPAAAQRQAP